MGPNRVPPAARAVLAVAVALVLLGLGGAGSTGGGPEPSASLTVTPLAGVEQGLLRDRIGGSVLPPGSQRDGRERAGVGLFGALAAVVAVAAARLAARIRRPGGRLGRRGRGAAVGPRAPPPLRLA
jgi:hypothetical protein